MVVARQHIELLHKFPSNFPCGNLSEQTASPENTNNVKDHHSDPPDIAKQVTFLNVEKDTTKRKPNPKFNRRGDNMTDSEDTSVVNTTRSAVENEELHPKGLEKVMSEEGYTVPASRTTNSNNSNLQSTIER
jgi:hypothetical protein